MNATPEQPSEQEFEALVEAYEFSDYDKGLITQAHNKAVTAAEVAARADELDRIEVYDTGIWVKSVDEYDNPILITLGERRAELRKRGK